MQWVTRKRACLLTEYAASLPEDQRTTLSRLRFHQVSRSRYGWKTRHGHRAMLVALQGFDSS